MGIFKHLAIMENKKIVVKHVNNVKLSSEGILNVFFVYSKEINNDELRQVNYHRSIHTLQFPRVSGTSQRRWPFQNGRILIISIDASRLLSKLISNVWLTITIISSMGCRSPKCQCVCLKRSLLRKEDNIIFVQDFLICTFAMIPFYS